jgi:hypothetical protein
MTDLYPSFNHLISNSMKASRKVNSLIRRNQPFFALTFDWNTKSIEIIQTYEEYKKDLENLR